MGVEWCDGPFWVIDTAYYTSFDNTINPRFFYYFVDFVGLNHLKDGTSNPSLNRDTFAIQPFPLPPPKYQQYIVDILGSLDDKIELNRRMNATLDGMAQAIFRDWFVDFGPSRRKQHGADDPVQVMGGLVQDPARALPLADPFPTVLGDDGLPEGWEQSVLGDAFDVTMGQSPPGSTYNDIGEGLPFFQGRRDFGFRFPTDRIYCSKPSRIAEADWTLIRVRAPVGDVNRAACRCCIGRGVSAIRHKESLLSFTYYSALQLREILASYDNDGTVFGSINQKQLKALTIVRAEPRLDACFDDLVSPIDQSIRNNTDQSQTLAAIRDLLLPKLMSGEIRLRDAEKAVEDAA